MLAGSIVSLVFPKFVLMHCPFGIEKHDISRSIKDIY
jgi:hypothetical protein